MATNREKLRAKPEVVQVVIRAMMTKASLDDDRAIENAERYCGEALGQWEQFLLGLRHAGDARTEIEIAEDMVSRLRKQEVWGKILRGDAV